MKDQNNIDSIILDTFGQNNIFVEAGGSDPEDQRVIPGYSTKRMDRPCC